MAYDLYKKGMEAFEFGCLSDALPALQSCYQIRTKAMYAHHVSEHHLKVFENYQNYLISIFTPKLVIRFA